MTPTEREKLEIEIYLETKNHRGCIEDAADFLRHRDSSRISRLVNPNDTRAHNIFGEVLDVIQGFNHKHPKLAQFIWKKMALAANSFMDTSDGEIRLTELAEVADSAAREQLDVNSAINLNKPVEVIRQEAFEAYEKSRIQYEKAMALTGSGQTIEKVQ